jgi:proton-dependent oligopeptide transporter, POT family
MKDIAFWNQGDWIAAIAAFSLAMVLIVGGFLTQRKSEQVVGHPRGLFVLFYAEMWERFSYYGMRALLILYLTKFWLFSDDRATLTYGSYTALVFLTPVLGGYLADRWMGQRKGVIFGGVLLVIGHALMAVEGMQGITDPLVKQADPVMNVLWLALALIGVGTGFLKGNISVIVGQLYRRTDGRRDAAYTIFYMGVNVGSALGSILVGYLGETIGWAYGFGLAGVGMVAGLVIFIMGQKALDGRGMPPKPLTVQHEIRLYGVGLAAVAGVWGVIQFHAVMQNLMIACLFVIVFYTLYAAYKMEREPRQRIFAILFLIALNPLFWALFEQTGGSFSLYMDRFVDRGGVPTSLFQSINPVFIIALSPLMAWLWQSLAARGRDPSAPVKFALALAQIGLGFLVLVWGARSVGMAVLTPVIFVFLMQILHTTAELCLSPVGLSAMTRLAPSHMAGFFMGAWFYTMSAGNFLAGWIGSITGGAGGKMSKEVTLQIYTQIGWVAVAIGAVVLVWAPLVTRWMHLDALKDDGVP